MEVAEIVNNDVVHPEVRAHINSLVSAVSQQSPLSLMQSCLTDRPRSSVDGVLTTTVTNSETTP